MTRIPLTASAARVVGRESDAAPGAMSSTPAQDNNTFPDAAADIDQKHRNPPVGGPALPVVSVEEPAEESEDGEEMTDNDEDEEHDVADDERLEPGVASEIGLRRRMGGRRDGTKHKIIKIPIPAARVRLPPHPEPSAVPSVPSRAAGKAGQVSRPPEVSSKPGLETLNFWGPPGRGALAPGGLGLDGPVIEKDLDSDVQLGDPKSNNKSGQDSRGQNIGRLQDYQLQLLLREHVNKKRLQLARLDQEMHELKLLPAIDEAPAFAPLRGSGFPPLTTSSFPPLTVPSFPPLTIPSIPPLSVSESVSHYAPNYNPDHPPVPNRNHFRDHPPIPKEPSFQPATTMAELFTKELDKTAERTTQAVTQEIRRTTAEIKDEISELESKYKATAATLEETTGQNTYMMQELYEMRTTNAALRDELRQLRLQNEEFKDQIKITMEFIQSRESDRTRMYGASGPFAPRSPGAPNPPSTPWLTCQHPLLQAQCGQFPGSSMRDLNELFQIPARGAEGRARPTAEELMSAAQRAQFPKSKMDDLNEIFGVTAREVEACADLRRAIAAVRSKAAENKKDAQKGNEKRRDDDHDTTTKQGFSEAAQEKEQQADHKHSPLLATTATTTEATKHCQGAAKKRKNAVAQRRKERPGVSWHIGKSDGKKAAGEGKPVSVAGGRARAAERLENHDQELDPAILAIVLWVFFVLYRLVSS